ncbi:MAG: hypothetical protein EPN30_06190 [Actinomycetota bacterium]|nr:MAG: hypothetical protein EPN30_06190 [Actinomycetota bacterium]
MPNETTPVTKFGSQLSPLKVSGNTPPPSVPLAFFEAAFLGLIACGIALIISRNQGTADPTSDVTVAAAHLGMLATLSMGLLGAIHQFTPVVTQRPLRSTTLSRATFAAWLIGAWCLPLGIGTEHEIVVEIGGIFAATAIVLLIINLWSPLGAKGKGSPVIGLRFAVAGFALTACFGVVYVFDRSGNWFDLSGHVVLAHASIGLFAWLGLTYVSVAERLWPMFFLAHIAGKRRAGLIAVLAIPLGILFLSPGLLFKVTALAWLGGAVLLVGLGSHLVSLAMHLTNRKRKIDLYFIFVVTSSISLLAGVILAAASALVIGSHYHLGVMLAAAAITAFGGWILEAFVGHIHKVIPFVVWSMFRGRGITKNLSGGQLMFGDLYNHSIASVVYGLVTLGIASTCFGFADSGPAFLAIGGGLLSLSGILLAVNLSVRSIQMSRPNNKKLSPLAGTR